MKDVLINASILSSKNTGLGVYTLQIIEHLCPLLSKNNISFEIMCGSKEYLPSEVQDKAKIISFSNPIERNINMMRLYNADYQVVLSTTHHGALFPNTKQIITIHDIIPLLYPKGRRHQYFYYKMILPRIIKKSEGVITVSNHTKKDITSIYKKWIETSDKVKIIGESIITKNNVTNDFTTTSIKYKIEKGKYFCIVGIHYWYKNIQIVINTFKNYPNLQKYKVVIIGNDKNKYGEYLHFMVNKYNLNDNFIFTGFTDDELKNSLISNSLCCIHPSLYEGFGLPLLEAMYAKVPIISSNSSSLSEVGGNAAIYFDPQSQESLYSALYKVITDPSFRMKHIEKGKENLKRYNWETIAEQLYNYLINFI